MFAELPERPENPDYSVDTSKLSLEKQFDLVKYLNIIKRMQERGETEELSGMASFLVKQLFLYRDSAEKTIKELLLKEME